MPNEHYELQILLTSGDDFAEKAVLAVATALAAAAHGIPVAFVMAMRGAQWCAASVGNDASVDGYPPMGELVEMLIEAGGAVQGCNSCVEQFCPAPKGEDGLKVLRSGITRVGLNEITLRMTSVQTVTF